MIKDLKINQEMERLEYAVENDFVCTSEGQCYPVEKLEVYHIMQGVIKNWNECNKELQLSVQTDEVQVGTRTKLKEVLDEILLKIVDDSAPSVGSDDTVIDLETDAELILMAIKQLHNKYGVRHAKLNNYKYGEYEIKLIKEEDIEKLNRGGYSTDDWGRIYFILTGKFQKQRADDSEDIAE